MRSTKRSELLQYEKKHYILGTYDSGLRRTVDFIVDLDASVLKHVINELLHALTPVIKFR